MSHDLDEDHYYKSKGGMIPVKWTAPEAVLYKKYTTKSDVWSYGMVMYEIWSLGCKPFEEFDINSVRNLLTSRHKGFNQLCIRMRSHVGQFPSIYITRHHSFNSMFLSLSQGCTQFKLFMLYV